MQTKLWPLESRLFRSNVIYTFHDETNYFDFLNEEEIVVIGIDIQQASDGQLCLHPAALSPGHSPAMVAGIFTFRAERMHALQQIARELQALGITYIPEPALINSREENSIKIALSASTQKLIKSQASLIVALASELAHMRIKIAELESNRACVESFMQRTGVEPHRLVYSTDLRQLPTSLLVLDANCRYVADQVLPTSSKGLTSFALHFVELTAASCSLSVSLHSIEDKKQLGAWTVAAHSLREGWNTFSLGRSLGALQRTLSVQLIAHGRGEPLKVSLGRLQPNERFKIRDARTSAPISDRNLALRAWVGLPGLTAPEFLCDKESRSPDDLLLRGWHLRGAKAYLSGSRVPIGINLRQEQGAVSARVGSVEPIRIELPKAVPRNAVRVSARVHLLKSAESSVSCALSVTDQTNSEMFEENALEYVTVGPGETSTLELFLAANSTTISDLFLHAKQTSQTIGLISEVCFDEMAVFVSPEGINPR